MLQVVMLETTLNDHGKTNLHLSEYALNVLISTERSQFCMNILINILIFSRTFFQ